MIRRAGFTLMEVVVATVIVVMIAAATLPSLMTFIDRQRAQTTATQLATLASGIVNGTNAGFFNLVHSDATTTTQIYPGLVHDLGNPLSVGVAADHNSCGSAVANRYNATEQTQWNSNGPFVNFAVSATGIVTPIGTVLDSIKRDTIGGTQFLSLRIDSVLFDDAKMLDRIVDNGDSATAGSVRWGAFSGNFVNVKYEIPINPTHC